MTRKTKQFTQEDWAKDLRSQAENRLELLRHTVRKLESNLNDFPEGMLRDVKHRDGYQYYWRKNTGDKSGKYISKSDSDAISALANKEYRIKFIQAADKEIKALENYLTKTKDNPVEKVYDSIKPGRKPLIDAVITPDDLYIRQWEDRTYEPGYFAPDYPEYYSAKGERVRSKAEENIANLLILNKVPYHYECHFVIGGEEKRPDFYCLNVRTKKEYLWEHFGMMDNTEYARNNVEKINKMAANGYVHGQNCIFTFETSILPLNTRIIQLMIDKFLL